MKKAIVLPNILKDPSLSLTALVAERLLGLGIVVYLDESYNCNQLEGITYYNQTPSDADFLVVIGGDGSVIDASVTSIGLDIPLLGINIGKVGYLATVEPDQLEILSKITESEARIDEKMLLVAERQSADGNIIRCDRLAVNDVVISHDSYLGISDIRLENQCGDIVQYRADGVIVATPAGSTAYSLSAGGPIVSHGLETITVTPICPHSFFNRSIVYAPDEKIIISNMGDEPLNVSIDGRLFDRLGKGESCNIYKSERYLKMLNLEDTNLFSTLSKKIKLLHDLV